MRWAHAKVLTLYQLQNGMCIYTSGEETKSSKGVCANTILFDGIAVDFLLEPNTSKA